MRFGVHLSMSGGLDAAPKRGREIGCQTFQIFSGNPRGWQKSVLDPGAVAAFRAAVHEGQLDPVVVHATYLINLAAPDAETYQKSVGAFLDELQRAASLGASFYVVHCGSHKGTDEEAARRRIVAALDQAAGLADAPVVLLENTAGTQNSLGTTFPDLAQLLDRTRNERAGICFDTCHALCAGYEIRTWDGVRRTLDALEEALGLKRLKLLHINDSKGDLNSRIDRHEHIGQGFIGKKGFTAFFSDQRLWNLPAILETPLDDPDDDQRNLWMAAELAASAGAVPPAYLATMPTAELAPIEPRLADESAEKGQGAPKPRPKRKPAKAAGRTRALKRPSRNAPGARRHRAR